MGAIALVGTDREDTDEGTWWASTSGSQTMTFVADLVGMIRYLPSPKADPGAG